MGYGDSRFRDKRLAVKFSGGSSALGLRLENGGFVDWGSVFQGSAYLGFCIRQGS